MPGILCNNFITWFSMIQNLKIQQQEHKKVIPVFRLLFWLGWKPLFPSVFCFTNSRWLQCHDLHYSELHLDNFLVIVVIEFMSVLRNSTLILSEKSSKNCSFCCCLFFLKKPRVKECSAKWCAGRMGCIPSPCVSLLGCCRQKGLCNFSWN